MYGFCMGPMRSADFSVGPKLADLLKSQADISQCRCSVTHAASQVRSQASRSPGMSQNVRIECHSALCVCVASGRPSTDSVLACFGSARVHNISSQPGNSQTSLMMYMLGHVKSMAGLP